MKFTLMARTVAFLMSLLGMKELPVAENGEQVNLTDEQKQKIIDVLGKKDAEAAIKGINDEIKAMRSNNLELKAIQDEIAALREEVVLTEEQLEAVTDDDGNTDLKALLVVLKTQLANQQAQINQLLKSPEDDVKGKVINMVGAKVKHSQTHLFASNLEYDQFDGRPWNRRAAGMSVAATDYNDATTIQKLNGDLDLFYRKNPDVVRSLHRDTFGLPDFWPKRTKVDDRVSDGTIVTAEITQGRKLGWLPKNRQKIEAEEGKIYPVQIDIEFAGFYLQQIETSWLNMMNKEGSQPYKESFVRFLVSELDKKARQEDRIACIQGVYVQTPEDATSPGNSRERMNGLLYLLQQARDITKKYRPFDVGVPTESNIIDYVDSIIKKLPDEVRKSPGLVLYLSEDWLRAYKRRYELIHGTFNNYEGYPNYPKDYNNIKFQHLQDLTGSDFMFITFDNNIEILENVPQEKSMYKFEMLKRQFYVMADYKLGIRLIHIGTEVNAGDPLEFAVQTVWSTTVPIFPRSTPFVTSYDKGTGKVAVNFDKLVVEKEWATEINEFTGVTPGTVFKIKGNTLLPSAVNIVDNAKINLANNAAFNLKSGGTITFYVNADRSVTELSRTTAPESASVTSIKYTTGTIDANLGNEFVCNAGSTVNITSIINGVEGKTIKIYGTDTASVDVVFSTSATTYKVTGAATLGTAAHFVQFTLVDGVWMETNRSIA